MPCAAKLMPLRGAKFAGCATAMWPSQVAKTGPRNEVACREQEEINPRFVNEDVRVEVRVQTVEAGNQKDGPDGSAPAAVGDLPVEAEDAEEEKDGQVEADELAGRQQRKIGPPCCATHVPGKRGIRSGKLKAWCLTIPSSAGRLCKDQFAAIAHRKRCRRNWGCHAELQS